MCEYFSIRCDVSCVYLELLIHPDPCTILELLIHPDPCTILDLLIHPDPYTCACPNAAEGCRIHLRVTSHPNTYHTPAHVPTQPKAAVYICELHRTRNIPPLCELLIHPDPCTILDLLIHPDPCSVCLCVCMYI